LANMLSVKHTLTVSNLSRVLGLTLLLFILLSVNYAGFSLSNGLTAAPIQLVFVAFFDTLLLGYFVASSRWRGWKEWEALFAMLFGTVYLLTSFESLYLGNELPTGLVWSLLVNGAIVSGIYGVVLVRVLGKGSVVVESSEPRLSMPRREWAWKIIGSGAIYLGLFFLVGLLVYRPLAAALDPTALAAEQKTAASAAMLVFPLELFRGALWAVLAAPAVIALRFGWKRTGWMMGLLFAVPVSGSIVLSTTVAPGLQLAHFVELFIENLVFGLLVVWILHIHSRLPL
jgi:hypothetical protein